MRYIHKYVVSVDVTNGNDKQVGGTIERAIQECFDFIGNKLDKKQIVKSVDCFRTEQKQEDGDNTPDNS